MRELITGSESRVCYNRHMEDCCLYAGYTNKDDYGKITYIRPDDRRQVNVYIHREMYIYEKGDIGKGLVIDHLCSTPRCINPDHLEAVTVKENVRRGRVIKSHCPLGHEYNSFNTHWYKRKDGYMEKRCKKCVNSQDGRRKRWPAISRTLRVVGTRVRIHHKGGRNVKRNKNH